MTILIISLAVFGVILTAIALVLFFHAFSGPSSTGNGAGVTWGWLILAYFLVIYLLGSAGLLLISLITWIFTTF